MKILFGKKISVVLVVAMLLSFTACANQDLANRVSESTGNNDFTTAASQTEVVSSQTEAVVTTASVTTVAVSSTKAETTVKEETTATTAESTPATTAEPTWKETKKSAEMYLNTSVYSRTKAYIGAPTADLYQINDKVKVVAVTDTDYYKLDNGKFIHRDFLSDKKTEIQTATVATMLGTTVPSTTAKSEKPKPSASGKYISSDYAPLDEKIEPILDRIITKKMDDTQKLKAVYDYLMQSSYIERTVLIPQDKKQYSEQIYACFILDNNYGVCYDFTSAFKYMTRALGFDTRMIYGYHTNIGGGASEHSWAELDIKGTTYIFDPAIEKILISEGYTGSSRFMRTYNEIGKYYIFG